jgi:hypothetical protein
MKTENTRIVFIYNKDNSITTIVKNRKNNEPIFDRTVRLRGTDTPNKIVGRRFAFEKAMTHARKYNVLPKTEVTALWNDFRSNLKQPLGK